MKVRTVIYISGFVYLGALCAGPSMAVAQERAGGAHADSRFVMQAAEGGMKEVEAGKIAGQRASDVQVTQFGQQMVEDHSKANEELKSIAGEKGIELPDEADAKAKLQAALAPLEKESGAAFDKAYMDEMVKDHEKTVALFESEVEGGQDPELQAFAKKTLPTLREHLEMSRELQTAMASKREP